MPSRRLPATLAFLAVVPGAAAGEDFAVWKAPDLSELAPLRHRATNSLREFDLQRTTVWGSGLARGRSANPFPADPSVGLSVRPLEDSPLAVGLDISRSVGAGTSSSLNWGYALGSDAMGGWLVYGLSAGGAVGLLNPGVSNKLSVEMGIPAAKEIRGFDLDLKVRPEVSYDALNGSWGAALTPEIRTRAVLRNPAKPFGTVLDLSLGYRMEPHTRPGMSAGFTLKVTLPDGV